MSRVFLTHGHLDHAAGLPFLLSQRAMLGLGATSIFCPAAIADQLRAFIRSAARLEERTYDYRLVGLRPGERVEVENGLAVESFQTDHVVPSLGYHLIREVNRLREDLISRGGDEIAALRRRGEEVTQVEERLWLSYPGDTAATILDREARLRQAKVLILECTFIGEHRRSEAAAFGHVHIDDLVERQHELCNERIVLHHLSRRFSHADLRREVESKLPSLAPRILILGEEDE